MKNICYDKQCTGCGACALVCPKNAISMTENTEGFVIPVVDDDKCIKCGLCIKKCAKHNDNSNPNRTVYAVVANDSKLLHNSTSGGFFGVLAKHIIQEGGYVYGVANTDDLRVKHIRIEAEGELSRLHGSKYVQSNASACFADIKEQLKAGKKLLFSGTGCQISGLLSFLGGSNENLITIEVVCHGVPSQGLFNKYIEWLGNKRGGNVTEFQFRSKNMRPTGEHSQFTYICNNKRYKGQAYEDPYYSAFLNGRILRESCYNCSFKGSSRVADFTIGDFWGVERQLKNFPVNNGTSAVLINTEKAEKLFDKIKDSFIYKETSYEVAQKFNPSLHTSTKAERLAFNIDDEALFTKTLKPQSSAKDIIKNRIPWKLKATLKKLR
jgi:coenzyme F420-reducing hydrogenase beta subunit